MDEKELNTCMFCLETQPKTIVYDGPCDCRPQIHLNCLKDWFEHVPNECPICRMDYDPSEEINITNNIQPITNRIMGINRNLLISYNYETNCILAFFIIAYLTIVLELFGKHGYLI